MNELTPIRPTLPSQGDFSLDPMNDYGASGSSTGGRRFFVFLRRYWWVLILALLLTASAAVGYILLVPPVFVSSSSMWETERLHLSEGALFTEDASTYIATQIELLKSLKMGQAALDRLRAADPTNVPMGKDGLPLPVSLNFKEAPKSTVFVITANSADAVYSQNFLNALMAGYLEYKQSVRKMSADETAASIEAQVTDAETELKTAEGALDTFQRTNNLAILQEEGTVAGRYLEKLQTDLSDLHLKSQLLKATEVERAADMPGNNSEARDAVDFTKSMGSTDLSTPNNAQLTPYQELELLKIKRAELSRYHKPKHPWIVALDAEIARCEKLIELYRGQTHDQLVAAQEAVNMNITNVLAQIKDWEGKVTESSAHIGEAERLKQAVNRAQSHYEHLAAILQNLDITRNTDMETLAILEPAAHAKRSYSQIITASALALVGGLVLGAGIIFLIEKRDDRFTSPTELNSILGDAIVGLVPEVAAKGKDPIRLLENDDSRHGYAESYRRLRSALLFLATEGDRPKVLLITSAMPNEGKSTVAANLARTLGLSGARVLLVDGDLRRGGLHHLLKLPGEPGLAEVLRRACEADKAIQKGPHLSFVAAGSHKGNPGDLFLGSALDEILARWRREYDYIVIDSSPLFATDDASCLAPKADGTLFVVRRDHSSARAVHEALDLLAQRQARVLGVIFNGADASARNYYYYKFAGYNASAKTA